MNGMAEALLKSGLVAEERFNDIGNKKTQQTKTEVGQKLNQLTAKSRVPINLDRLTSCSSVKDFGYIAKNLLSDFPEEIDFFVEAAHQFKGMPGGKRLIWTVYQVKEKLPKIKPDFRKKFLNRAFRKSGATTEISKEQLL